MICNINRHLRTDVQVATKVSLMPKSDADYAALSLSSQAAEESSVLSQVAVVSAGMSFPLWVDANKQLVTMKVKDIQLPSSSSSKSSKKGGRGGGGRAKCGMLAVGTELVVLDPSESQRTSRKKTRAGKAAVDDDADTSGGGKREEVRVIALTPAMLTRMGIEDAILSLEEHVCVWEVRKGYAAPDTLEKLGAGGSGSVVVKVVPKVLEGESQLGGMASICICIVPCSEVPADHLALAPNLVESLGIESLQRVFVSPLSPSSSAPRDALSFSVEMSELLAESGSEDESEEEDEKEEGDKIREFFAPQASSGQAIINALVNGLKEEEDEAAKDGRFLILSKGMILEVFDDLRAKNLKFVVSKIAAASGDDRLADLGALEHVCVHAEAAGKDGVEYELKILQPTRRARSKDGEDAKAMQTYERSRDVWECPWLLSARAKCIEMLQMALDPKFSRHFLKHAVQFPGGVLVHGPSGSGKTVLRQSVCCYFSRDIDLACKIVLLDCRDFAGNDTEKMKKAVRVAVSKAVECQPSLLAVENIDRFESFGDGQASMETFQHEVFSEYLSHLMDCVRTSLHRVSFLSTARSLDGVHKSLKKSGCFDNHFAMPLPSRREKAEIFGSLSRAKRIRLGEETLDHVAENCDGLDVLDMDALVELTLHEALSNLIRSADKDDKGDSLSVSREEIASILERYVPIKARGTSHKLVADDGDKVRCWGDIRGMPEATRELEDLLSFSSKYKDLVSKCPLRLRTGALLYGPPGCGKTFLVRCAAKICNLRIITVKGPELLNKYIGASEAGVRELFQKASGASPCILFFDEFDAIAPKRGHDNTGVTDRVVNQFLAELDGIESLVGVFVLAATSRPDMIDPALLRPGRLDRMVYLSLPGERERYSILCKALDANGDGEELGEREQRLIRGIAARTSSYTGADLVALLSEAELLAAKEELSASSGSADPARSSLLDHLERALEKSRPSLGKKERERLDLIYTNFKGDDTPPPTTTNTNTNTNNFRGGETGLRVSHA